MTKRPTGAEPVAKRPATWRLGRWPLVLLILLSFALRVHDLGGREFWFDEAVSANVSRLGWEGVVTHLRVEPFEHPPLYYLSLYPWQKVAGTSEFAFRFFSVIWGILFVPLLYVLVKRLTSARSEHLSRLAALLASLSPFLVAYSQEARMYTLVPFLALLVLLSLHNALQRGKLLSGWLAYVLLMAVGLATHYFFALIWVTVTVYLLLEFLRERRFTRWGITVQLLLLLAVTTWLVAAPGLRSSLARIWGGETIFSLAYKLDKIIPTLMLADVGRGTVPLVAYVLATGGWVLVLMGIWWSRQGQVLTTQAWRMLVLFLVVPLVAALLIPYHVLGRHLGYALTPILIFIALSLVALRRRGWSRLVTGALAFLLFASYGFVTHYRLSNGDFGQAMDYIDKRAQPEDVLVLSQPAQHPLVTYYNTGAWPVRYVPPGTIPPTPGEVDDYLGAIAYWRSRMWLGPIGAWTADPELLVEQWLATNAFQSEKTWFPDSSSVALYFTANTELGATRTHRFVWGGRIRLLSLQTDPLQVTPGDALRMRFLWQAGMDLDVRYAVRLSLVDDQGVAWAERHSEPCGGWCPTNDWQSGQLQQDQHALLIPPGTPPGTYHLQLAWLPFEGGAALQVDEDGQRVEQVTAAQVTVLHPQGKASDAWVVPNSLQATFGGEVTLLGYEPAKVKIQVGENLQLETHWRAETTPADDYVLLVELVDRHRRVAASWESVPSAYYYPTGVWQPGEYLRGQHDLRLPSTLRPGRYRLQVALVSSAGEQLALGGQVPRQVLGGLVSWQHRLDGEDLTLSSVRVVDRHRQFDLPEVTQPFEATVGRQAHLVGYDLDLSHAYPAGQADLTLYWRAGGPMVRPFKVFTHLIDDQETILAQHDAAPGGGCCLTNTWVEGEIIVDQHPLSLSADLPPGTYYLVVGMYDEPTASRLPAFDAEGHQYPDDRVQIEAVTIERGPGTGPAGPKLDIDYVVYIPLLHRPGP